MTGGFSSFRSICNGQDYGTDATNARGTLLNTLDTWVQLIASTPYDTSFIVVQSTYNVTNEWLSIIDIGIGSAGNEIVIIPTITCYNNNISAFKLNVPAGSRISARLKFNAGPEYVVTTVSIQLFDSDFITDGAAGIDIIGYVSADHGGTICPLNAQYNEKGAYGQLTASTDRDYYGFYVDINCANNQLSGTIFTLTDIAIGSAGNEIDIIQNIQWFRHFSFYHQFFPIPIPAGTRIAARASSGVYMGIQNRAMLYGVYK